MTLGQTIRTMRESLGLSLRALADAVAVSIPYMSQIECDKKIPSRFRSIRIAEELGMDPASLLPLRGCSNDLTAWLKTRPDVVLVLREAWSLEMRLGIKIPIGVSEPRDEESN